jgi:lipopolysaccharide/colanic/teichoic acid biosynthesis glycosyltransferase
MNPPNQLTAVAEHRLATLPAEDTASFAIDISVLEGGARSVSFYERVGKRILDVSVAAVLFLLSLPLLLVTAIAIKLDSRGPILFRSIRCGRGGKPFVFYKLRSMGNGAHSMKPSLLHLNEVDGPVFKLSNDPRITRVGRWLRRTSIDELPQLWNVLRGDMSLVGPRPPIPEEVEQYTPTQRRRLSVKPGLTCLWQVQGRSDLSFDKWVELDLQYIFERSFATDVKILARTIPAVLSCKGAY